VRIVVGTGNVAVIGPVAASQVQSWNARQAAADLALHEMDAEGNVCVPAGLVLPYRRELEDAGHAVEVTDQRRWKVRFKLDRKAMRVTGLEGRFAEAVMQQPIGLVEVRSVEDVVEKGALLHALHPGAKLVFAVPSKKLLRKLRRQLEARLDEPVGQYFARHRQPGKRCLVSTYKKLDEFEDTNGAILLLVAVEKAVGKVEKFVTGERAYARVYGLLDKNASLEDRTTLGVQALAGDLIYRLPRTVTVSKVMLVKLPSDKVKCREQGLERKRRTIWKNEKRNRAITRLAQAIHAGDRRTLGSYGHPEIAGELGDGQQHRVAVLAESTEHARQLAPVLGWPILHARPGSAASKRVGADNNNVPGGVIVTVTHAHTHGIDADVLIRATGGAGPLEVKIHPKERDTPQPGLVVIDVVDTLDGQARIDTYRRAEDYCRKGWLKDLSAVMT
jgi:hypothetical protein